MTMGDCSVAAVMVPPMRVSTTETTGSEAQAIRWAKGGDEQSAQDDI